MRVGVGVVPYRKSLTRIAANTTSNHHTKPLRHLQVFPISKIPHLILTQLARVVQQRQRHLVQLLKSVNVRLAVLGFDRHG
jgi:hypothetical protein